MGDTTTTGGDTMIREETKTGNNREIHWFVAPEKAFTYTEPATVTIEYTPSKKNVIAIIPARGNSKSIKRKNLKLFREKPLVQWTIEAASGAKSISKVVLTTEDNEIARLASILGVGRVIDRPAYLSQDHVQVEEVVLQALRVLEYEDGEKIDIIVVLHATSPLRISQDIDNAAELFLSGNGKPVISGCIDNRYHWQRIGDDFYSVGHDPYREGRFGRQWNKSSDMYIEDGSIYVVDAERFSLRRTFWYEDPPLFYILPEERSADIDTLSDWEIAEKNGADVK